MRGSTLVLDRLATLLTGVVLLALGAAAVAWPSGWLNNVWPATPERITTAPGSEVTGQSWWPWVCAGVGVVAVVAGVRWLLAHLPRRGIGALLLPGSGRDGRLLLAPGGPAEVAAEVFAETPGVRSARGRVVLDRRAIVVNLDAVVEPHADLTEVAQAADAVTADLRTVLGRDDITARVTLSVANGRRSIARVG